MEHNKCWCDYINHIMYGDTREVIVHFYGCPTQNDYKKYQQLKWYQKLFTKNPYKSYLKHLIIS